MAAVTAGPGVTNAVTAIKNAQMAESPLLLIGGAAASLQKVCRIHLEPLCPISFCWGSEGGDVLIPIGVWLQGRGALQDIDQLSLFRTLCKACVSVRAVRHIVPTLRQAIATAQSGTPGTTGEPTATPWGDLG